VPTSSQPVKPEQLEASHLRTYKKGEKPPRPLKIEGLIFMSTLNNIRLLIEVIIK
jgi:hypothetical protein